MNSAADTAVKSSGGKARFEITGAVLKWIAISLMFVNHLSYALCYRLGIDNYFTSTANWYLTRGAFVIFAFLISEGMQHTHDRTRYIFSLFLFAVISEIPFDLCFYQSVYELSSQNVFFTLGLGALAICGIDYFKGKPVFQILSVFIACVISLYLNTDYSMLGIVTITSFYVFRKTKWKQLLFTSLLFSLFTYLEYLHLYAGQFLGSDFPCIFTNQFVWSSVFEELHGLLAIPLLVLYKGRRGRVVNKWFFYGFYPGHLLLIWGVMSLILCFR